MTKIGEQFKCPICHGYIVKTTARQLTCGDPACISARTIQLAEQRFDERRQHVKSVLDGGCYFSYTGDCNGPLNVHMDGETYKEFSENDTKHSLFHLSDDEFSIFLDRSKKVYCTKHLLMISAMETAGKDWDEIVAVVIDKMLECQRP